MQPLIVFDGTCAWCNGWVRFLLQRDHRGVFVFASRQSAAAAAATEQLGVQLAEEHTLLVIEKGRIRRRSDAVLYILERLGGGWKLFGVFRSVPAPVRDALYDRVATYRHRLAGANVCLRPEETAAGRFLR